jgi:hypothetical protein
MSQTNNTQSMPDDKCFDLHHNPSLSQRVTYETLDAAFLELDVISEQTAYLISEPDPEIDALFQSQIPKRQTTMCYGPRILSIDYDVYTMWIDKDNCIIKSCITDKPVPNRRYNKKTGYVEKIDPTLEEEDRRLIVLAADPTAILEEDYVKDLIQSQKNS